MANRDIVYGIRITGDATSAVVEAKKVDKAFDEVAATLNHVESAAGTAQAAMTGVVSPAAVAGINAGGGAANEAAGHVARLGVSAGQTAQAMRQLPMQFTDIFTSLASGMPPMMVLMQQGGQLKDSFGGAGAAAKAMGGYVAGLVGPFTLAAAGVGVLTAAWVQGSSEAEAYEKTLAITGYRAGVTASELTVMAESIGKVSGTQGSAAEILNQLAGSGKVAAGQMEEVGAAISAMAETGARDVETLVKEFAAIAEDPVKGILKMNDAYNFLTPTIYSQVKALQEQGKMEEAVALAQSEGAKAVKQRAVEVEAATGAMERGWLSLVNVVKSAWSAMKDVGRESLLQQVAAQKKLIEEIRSGEQNGDIGAAQRYLVTLEGQAAAEKKAAEGGAARAASMKGFLATEKEVAAAQERGAKQTRTLTQALGEYRENLDKIRAADPKSVMLDPAKVAAGEAAIRKEFETTAKVRRAAAATPGERLDSTWVQRIQVLKAQASATESLTETERAAIRVMTDFANGKLKLTAAEKARLPGLVQEALLLDDAAEAAKKAKVEQEALAKAQEAAIDAVRADTQALLAKLDAAQFEAETYGMTEEAVYRLLAARAADRAEMNAFGDANDAVIAELKAQAKAYLDLAEAAGAKASREAVRKAGEDARASAQRFSDDLERALTDSLMRSFEAGKGFGQSFLDSIKNMLKTAALKAVVQVVMSPVTGGISGVAGASMSSSGAGGGSGLMGSASNINTLSNLGGYASIGYQWATGSMSGANAVGTVTANATGSGLDGLIAATDGWGIVAADAGSTTAAGMSGWGLAGGALGGAMLGYQLTDGNALGTFAGGGGGIAAYGAASSAMAGGSMAAGASAALAAIPVWGWIALAALAIGGSMVTGGTPHLGGAYVAGTDGQGFKATDANYGGFGLDWGAYNSDRNSGVDGATKALAEGVAGSLSSILGKFGLDNYYQVGVRFAADNEDRSPGAIRITNQAGEIVAEVAGKFNKSAQKGLEELAAKAGEAIQKTLLAADLPAWAEDTLSALGESPSIDQLNKALASIAQFEAAAGQITDTLGISTDAVYGLTKAFGGLSSAGAALSNYYQLFYSDVERTADAQAQLAEQFGALGQTMPENKAAFRSLVESIDMTTTAGQQLYAQLITLASPFATVADAVATARAAIEQEAAGLQQQIWSLTGDTASLRAAELAALDPANRALQARIYALQDEQAAQRAASDATALATAQVQAMADAWTDVFARSGSAYAASADAALASFERAAQRERTRLTAARDAASEAVSSVRSVLDLLAGAITDLYSQVDSAAGGQAASSMALIARAAEGGYMPAREDLSAAISAARAGINGTEYASQVDADRARLVLAGQLSRIQAVGSAQLPVAERALAAANEQLGALEQSAQLYRAQLNELKGIRESSRDIEGTVEDVGRLIVAELRAQSAAFSSTVIAAMQTGRVGTDVASQQLVSAGVATDRFSTVGGQQVYVSSRGAIYTSSDNMIRTNNGWAGGVDEARRIVAETFAKTSPADFYAAATRVGLSGAMIDEMYQFPAGTAAEWAKSNNLPAFAVGTDYVPDDMLALVHRGERITPAPYSGQQERLMEALIAEVQSLRATLALVAAESRRTADAVNGNSDAPMLVETV